MSAVDYASLFVEHRQYLFGLCYRMTGSAADADDLVQDTFAKVMHKPPRDLRRSLRPWLTRVAMNLCRDALRRRRRRGYVGPWLPSPVEEGAFEPPSHEPRMGSDATTAGRYELLESVSFAFLIALEALTPQQRAVLLLRDVFDYSVKESAEALAMREPNVKTTHHRARARMAAYDVERAPERAMAELGDRARDVLGQLVTAFAAKDHGTINRLVAAEVRAYSDGGGEFFAARKPIIGRDKVVRAYINLANRHGPPLAFDMRDLNGAPAIVVSYADTPNGWPPRVVLRCELDRAGRVIALHSIVASCKLTAVSFRS